MPAARCSTAAFYAGGRKVTRADDPKVLIDGHLHPLTLQRPDGPDQVHLSTVPPGAPALLADGTVVAIVPQTARGRRGRNDQAGPVIGRSEVATLTGLGVPVEVVLAHAPALARVEASTHRPFAAAEVSGAVRTLAEHFPADPAPASAVAARMGFLAMGEQDRTARTCAAALALAAVAAVADPDALARGEVTGTTAVATAAANLRTQLGQLTATTGSAPVGDDVAQELTARATAVLEVLAAESARRVATAPVMPAGFERMGGDPYAVAAGPEAARAARDAIEAAAGHLPVPREAWAVTAQPTPSEVHLDRLGPLPTPGAPAEPAPLFRAERLGHVQPPAPRVVDPQVAARMAARLG